MNKTLPRQEETFMPCATTDPEVFHDKNYNDIAKGLCAACFLEETCRSWGRANGEWGTWGGETSEERAAAGFPPDGWRDRTRS
ncbi:WhiB family transcriptional regulator [Streptomyces nigrescens]|uniref:WhiB family transcriptional regulator n=1 Tax=Streptomyces nigrescens TaxID=1920 RepID=UPI0036F86F3B